MCTCFLTAAAGGTWHVNIQIKLKPLPRSVSFSSSPFQTIISPHEDRVDHMMSNDPSGSTGAAVAQEEEQPSVN